MKCLLVILSNELPYFLKIEIHSEHSLAHHNMSDGSRYNGSLPSEVAACIGIKRRAIWHALL